MHTASPGQTVVLNISGIPSGSLVGYQVIKAVNGLVAIPRTTSGVVERPAGAGNFVVPMVAPSEGELYLVVADWSAGVLDELTTKVEELLVTADVQPGSSGLGAVADYAKRYIGGETWRGLSQSGNYGTGFIFQAVEIVKRRVMVTPPATVDEGTLPLLVLDYLGLCVALELIPAARDYWGSQHISISEGNDPTEIVSYTDRAKLMDDLQDDLLRRLAAARALALPLVDGPVLIAAADGPAIDETSDERVTEDPRTFPNIHNFPFDRDDPRIGRTGVRL